MVSFNSGKFAPLVTRTKPNPSIPAIQDPDLFTIAGPPYPGSPTPPPYTSYPAPPEPVTPPPVVYTQQSYVASTAPAPAVEVVTEAAAEIKIADVMATKMTPFVDLGEAAEDGTDAGLKEIMQDSMPEVMKEAIKELPRSSEQGVVKVQLTEDDIRDIMEAVKKETEEAETHSITKTDLVEMAVERLREMEDKLGSDDEDDDGNHNFQAIFLSW